jgi:rhamnogalacturonan endolyase
MRILSLLCLLLVCCLAVGAALPSSLPADEGTGLRFSALLQQMRHQEWTRRQEAEDEMVGLGGRAEPLIREALAGERDVDVRLRLEVVLGRLRAGAVTLIEETVQTTLPTRRGQTSRDDSTWNLSNGIVSVKIIKRTGELASLVYKGIELMSGTAGNDHARGRWEPASSGNATAVTIDPAHNGGERAEVAIHRPQGSGSALPAVEIRYCLERGLAGMYTYAAYRSTGTLAMVDAGGFAARLNGEVFDEFWFDSLRHGPTPSGDDWNRGRELTPRGARRLSTGPLAGTVVSPYDYGACPFELPAYGWLGTRQKAGFFVIHPSTEYLGGGPASYAVMMSPSDGLRAYWTTSLAGPAGARQNNQVFDKVVGPILIYVNSLATPEAMFQDALDRAARERKAWPYDWVVGVSYPRAAERGAAVGRVVLDDPLAPAPMPRFTNLLVGLIDPRVAQFPAVDRANPTGAWQLDSTYYQFWARGESDGSFTIPNVRPGKYELHAFADGVLGELALPALTIEPGRTAQLGPIVWRPLRHGRQLWEIGIPNRSAAEYLKGDDYWHWGMFMEYARLFPNDVNYVISKSDFRKDWYFQHVPHSLNPDGDLTGTGGGRSTPWTISFDLPEAPRGRAVLRVALCGWATTPVGVAVNGRRVGDVGLPMLPASLATQRIGGVWIERQVVFDASFLKAGPNVLILTVPAGDLLEGVLYDYLRLELDEQTATPQP